MASLPIGNDTEKVLGQASPTFESDVFERYLGEVRRLLASPCRRLLAEHRVVPAHRAKRIDQRGERWLSAHPSYCRREKDGIAVSAALTAERGITFDTQENRFLRYTLDSTVARLRALARQYKENASPAEGTFVKSVEEMITVLQRLTAHSFLNRIPVSDGRMPMPVPSGCRALYQYHRMLMQALREPMALRRVNETVSVSEETARLLSETDWDVYDVLVGSLGSVEQFKDNLRRNYYYAPEGDSGQPYFPVRYVALYQSARLFGEDAGIRYYGEVTTTRRLKRKRIRFPMRRNNGEDWYYAFRIEEWRQLPVPVAVRDEWVSEPRRTNFFLLTHCDASYALFHVHSAEQYRLWYELTQIAEQALRDETDAASFYPLGCGGSVLAREKRLEPMDREQRRLFDSSFAAEDFLRHPKKYFHMISEKMLKERITYYE